MLSVNVDAGDSLKAVFTSHIPLTVSQVWDHIKQSNVSIFISIKFNTYKQFQF